MSQYLVDRIRGAAQYRSADRAPKSAGWKAKAARWSGALEEPRHAAKKAAHAIGHLFPFIGADPNTDWLAGSGIALDDKGFVITGAGDGASRAARPAATACSPSAMCAAGSVKRVAAAVGEGAQVVAALHAYLGRHARRAPQRKAERMADSCTHLDTHPQGHAQRPGLRGMPEDGR